MKCANNIFDELEFTKNQAIHLCAFLSDMPAGEDKNAFEKRRNAAYIWSCVDKKKVLTTIDKAEGTLDRIQGFIDELKPS
jgi:uncharacterized protein (UPF0332 family)